VAVTALQLSAAYSSVANGGVLMEPRLVLAVGNRRNAPVRIRRSVSPEALGRLRSMLEGVVLRGTGQSVQVPGFPTAGKTGTAQKIDARTGKYSHSDYVSSFVGFVPAGEPRFAILVAIDGPRVGYYGAEVAGPVFSRIARELLALSATAPSLPLSVRIPTGPNASRLAPRPAAAPEPPGPGEGAGLKAGSPARSPQAGAKAPRVPA
jgi:cell division protein FtsI (penicillin-binding protein 3)